MGEQWQAVYKLLWFLWGDSRLLPDYGQLRVARFHDPRLFYLSWTETHEGLHGQPVEMVPRHDGRDDMEFRDLREIPDSHHGRSGVQPGWEPWLVLRATLGKHDRSSRTDSRAIDHGHCLPDRAQCRDDHGDPQSDEPGEILDFQSKVLRYQ